MRDLSGVEGWLRRALDEVPRRRLRPLIRGHLGVVWVQASDRDGQWHGSPLGVCALGALLAGRRTVGCEPYSTAAAILGVCVAMVDGVADGWDNTVSSALQGDPDYEAGRQLGARLAADYLGDA